MMIVHSKNSLAELSNLEFLRRLDTLIKKEKQITLKVLHYLIEMDRRRLYAAMGYASLFEYCTRHLGYSESGANRRIRAARCIRDFPEVYDMLEKNELDLCKVSLIYGTLTDENQLKLLPEIRNRSYRKINEIVARYNPKSLLRDRVRPVYIKRPAKVCTDEADGHRPPGPGLSDHDKNTISAEPKSARFLTANVGGRKSSTCEAPNETTEILEKKYKLEFAVRPEVMAKIEKARMLLSKKYPRGVALEQLLDVLLNEYLEKHSPERKLKRREKRKSRKQQAIEQEQEQKRTTGCRQTAGNMKSANKKKFENINKVQSKKSHQSSKLDNKTRSRYIPAAVQDKVYARDNGRCSYTGPDGTRCNSTWNLQIDHIIPFAKGGDHSMGNLRLLCAKHNSLEAEKTYGAEFMKKKMNNSSRPCRE